MSLDGFIATADGGFDWIPEETTIDWGAFLGRFDTVLMGRKTYEIVAGQGDEAASSGMRSVVVSRTLAAAEHPDVEVVAEDAAGFVRDLRNQPGKEIWLMGGGELFRSLFADGLVDRIEIALLPILLGGGIPGLPAPSATTRLALTARTEYPSGIVLLEYDVSPPTPERARSSRAR